MDKNADIKILRLDQFESGGVPEFYVNTLANHLVQSHLHIEKPHRHDFYVTMLFTQGRGLHHIDFTTHEVKPGSLFAMAPGQVHYWELSSDADGWIFFHSRAGFESFFAAERLHDYHLYAPLQKSDALQLDAKNAQAVGALMADMYHNSLQPVLREKYVLTLALQVYVLVEQLLQTKSQEDAAAGHVYQDKFRKFGALLEAHFRQHKTVSFYAGQLHMTPKHLNRICQTLSGKSCSEWIASRVMLEAKRLLVHAHNGLGVVAETLGFEDYAYFSKWFRKNSGETPSQFAQKSGSRLQ